MKSFKEFEAEMDKKYGTRMKADTKQPISFEGDTEARGSFESFQAGMDKKYGKYNLSSSVDSDYINKFFSDASAFTQSAQTDYEEANSGNISSIYTKRKASYDDLRSRSWNVRQYLEKNKGKLNSEAYTSLIGSLDQFDQFSSSANWEFYKASQYGFGDNRDYEGLSASDIRQKQGTAAGNDIAYTGTDGKNYTWDALHHSASQKEDTTAKRTEYRQMADWGEQSGGVTNTSGYIGSDYQMAVELQMSTVPFTWEDAEYMGIDRALFDSVEAKRKYLEEKYGVNLHDPYGDTNTLANIQKQAEGEFGAHDRFKYLDEMTADEQEVLYYLFNTQGRGAAMEWYKAYEDIYQNRYNDTVKYGAGVLGKEMPVFGSAMSVATNLLAAPEYAADLLDYLAGGEKPYNTMANVTSATRGGVMDNIDWKVGNWEAGDFLYGTGMSAVDSMVSSVFGKAGPVLLGMSAAGQATNDAYDRGLDDNHAIWTGVAAGAAEMIFEAISIGNFKNLKEIASSSGKEILKNLAKTTIVNCTEELATEIANIGADFVINDWISEDDFSEYSTSVRAYQNQGYTPEEAKSKSLSNLGIRVAEAGASGALMGFGFGTVGQAGAVKTGLQNRTAYTKAVRNAAMDEYYAQKYRNDIPGLLKSVLAIDPENQAAKAVQEKLDSGGKVTDQELRQLAETMAVADMEKTASARLQELGETGDVDALSKAAVKSTTGQKLTADEKAALKGSKYGAQVVGELSKSLKEEHSQAKSYAKDSVKGAMAFNKELSNALKKHNKAAQNGNIDQNAEGQDTEGTDIENAPEEAFEVSEDGGTIQNSTGNAVKIKEIASIKNGKMTLRMEDGSEVAASDVSYGTEAEALVYEAVATLEGIIDGKTATKLARDLIRQINEGEAVSDHYVRAVAEAYLLGYEGRGIEAARAETSLASSLTDRQRNYAYNRGAKYGTEMKATRQDTGRSDTKGRKKTAKRSKAPDGKSYDNVQFEGRVKRWGEKQRADVEFLNFVAKDIAGGVTVHVFESFKETDGKRYYYDSRGKLQKAPNGKYIDATGDIYLDLNAGDSGEGLVLNTFAHELYHHIEKWSPEKARQLAEFLVKEQGLESVEAMVKLQTEKAEAAGHGVKFFMKEQGMSRTAAENTVKSRAFSDFVADSLETVFTKGDALGMLQRLKKADRGLVERMKAFVDKWISKLKKFYQGDHTITVEGQATAQLEKFQQIQELFMEALVDAGENFRNADTVAAEKNTAEGRTGVAYSVRADFYKAFDAWDKKDTHVSFVIGTTSDVLKSIGMKDQNIVLRSGTVLQKLKDHPEMTFDIFKGIPELLKHPIIVQFSDAIDPKTKRPKYDSSITVLGELYADVIEQGKTVKKPVLVSLELLPTKNKGATVLNFAIIKSAYSKNALQQYLNENSILYIDPDKKRTDSWLSLTRLQLPFGENRYGSIRKIAYADGKVKVQNAKNMTGMQKALFDAGIIDEYGNQLLSDRNPTETSNRSLLVNALESAAQTDWEKKKLQEYKYKIQQIEEDERKMNAAKKQIYEMSFARGPRDADYKAKLQKLRTEALHAERRLNNLDQQLLRLEAIKPLQDVLKREKDKVKQRIEKKYQAEMNTQKKNAAQEMSNLREKYYKDRQKALADQRTRDSDKRKRTEMRKKIRNDIRDLTKMLKRGKDEQNVKEEMKDLAASTIAHGEALFIDYYTDDDIIRNGVGPGLFLPSNVSAMMNEAHDILDRLDHPPEVAHDDPTAWLQWDAEERYLKGQLNRLKFKLKEVFVEERNRMGSTMASDLMSGVFKAYEALANSDKEYIRNAYDYYVLEHLKGIKERLGNVKARDMNLRQLEDLHKAYTMVITTIRNANKAFTESRSVEQLAKQLVSELKGGKKTSKTKLMNMARNAADLMGWNYEKLYYALERIGSDTLTRLFNNLANSENVVMLDVIEAKEKQLEIIDKYGYNTWKINKQIDKDFVDNRGKKFRLTLGEMMLLYAYVRRGSVDKQLETGGFVFGEKALIEKLKDTDGVNSYKLTKAQCISITNTLTADQKNFVADMQTYLSGVMGAKGNEVSMMLYGVELFGEPNYIPVHVAGEYMARAEESKAKSAAGFGSMANAGFTKSKNVDAKAPIVLESFMDVWVDHVNEMSRYHGTVPALEDIRRVMNYSVYNDANTDSVSVKATLENSHGENALNYFDSLYREANSGAVMDKLQGFSKQALSKMRKLGVAYSLSVVVQQPASLVRAYSMIDKKYFGNIRIPGLRGMGTLPVSVAKTALNRWTKTQTKAYSEMMKYAPGVTLAKEIGGFDTASGGSIRTYLLDTDKSVKQKLKTGTGTERVSAIANTIDDNPVANIPNLADKMTWIEIWNACKRETADKYKTLSYGSKAFMEKVGERFTEVIRATQVYDSVFSKSPMLKSKNVAVQYLVSFMNEPNTVVNMVESAIRDVRNGDVRKGLRKMTAVVRSIMFTSVLKSVVYAMRDDDEDESFIEKYMQALTSNLIGDFTGLNYIPVLGDIWSLVQGYDVERPDMAIFADVIKDIKKYYSVHNQDTSDMTTGELDEWERSCTEAGWSLIGSVAGCFGIPVKNITREVKAVFNTVKTCANNAGDTTWKTIGDAVWQGIADELPWVDEEKSTDKLYHAITEGDRPYLERLEKGYIDPDGNFKENSYHTALRKGLRENDPRIQDAAEARRSGNTEEYLRIVDEIVDEGHFSEEDVVAAIRSSYNKLKDEDGSNLLYDAMVAGDDTAVEELKGNYINDEGEFSETSYRNAIQKGLRENDPRIQEAAEAYHNGDKSTYRDILQEIPDEGHFKRKDVKAAIMDVVDELEDGD